VRVLACAPADVGLSMHSIGVKLRACECACVYALVVVSLRLRAVPAHVALVSSCAHVNVRLLHAYVSASGLVTYTCGIAGSYTFQCEHAHIL
jgi:hypothetical protein